MSVVSFAEHTHPSRTRTNKVVKTEQLVLALAVDRVQALVARLTCQHNVW